MGSPDELERRFTLLTAVARYDELRARDVFASPDDPDERPLSRAEALELIALGEVIARKARYGRQLAVRTARAAGATWPEIAAALNTTKEAAQDLHERWLSEQPP